MNTINREVHFAPAEVGTVKRLLTVSGKDGVPYQSLEINPATTCCTVRLMAGCKVSVIDVNVGDDKVILDVTINQPVLDQKSNLWIDTEGNIEYKNPALRKPRVIAVGVDSKINAEQEVAPVVLPPTPSPKKPEDMTPAERLKAGLKPEVGADGKVVWR